MEIIIVLFPYIFLNPLLFLIAFILSIFLSIPLLVRFVFKTYTSNTPLYRLILRILMIESAVFIVLTFLFICYLVIYNVGLAGGFRVVILIMCVAISCFLVFTLTLGKILIDRNMYKRYKP